jgi:galactokinase
MNTPLINHIIYSFKNQFKTNPLLVFSPGRINIIGEHTDYNDGFVFPAAIDKGIVAAIQKSNSKLSTVVALDVNEQLIFSLENIKPISNGGWKNFVIGVIAEIQKKGKQVNNFNLVFAGDIPNGAGLSSSAALENSVVFSVNELFQLSLSKEDMIRISQQAEHNYVGVKCGIMDQYASMFGQKDAAILLDCQNLNAKTVSINLEDYEILLINTNVKHSLSDSAYNERRAICKKIAALLNINNLRAASESDLLSIKDQISKSDFQKAIFVIQENHRTLDAFKAIKNNDIEHLGNLLYLSHKGLQHQYKVSCDELDFLVDVTKNNSNIIGARMMGGGFGGCTINIIKKNSVQLFQKEVALAFTEKFCANCSFYIVNLSGGTCKIETN